MYNCACVVASATVTSAPAATTTTAAADRTEQITSLAAVHDSAKETSSSGKRLH